MAKFNTTNTRPAVHSPIVTQTTPTGRTHEGAPGYVREAKGELFLLAVANMVGEDTFYEQARDRDNRYAQLVRQVATDDAGWTLDFITWLRGEGNMRSASIVAACEAVHARLNAAKSTRPSDEMYNDTANRAIIGAAIQRADEPGELLAYWTSIHGRRIPKPVKRGVADAVRRLYNERSLLKYDTDSKGFRFGDVIDLVHPTPDNGKAWQGDLFRHALDRRHGRDGDARGNLPTIHMNASVRRRAADDPTVLLDSQQLREAGMTWEDVLSLAGSKLDKAKLWEAMIPSMGYMALLRNLRNFDEAGVSEDVAAAVIAKLSDPDEVARSRQFPFRFLAAYEQAPSLRWSHALDKALGLSLRNLPTLRGRSLILVDTSASMTSASMSAKSKMSPFKAAAVFGVALAARGEQVDLHGFASGVFRHDVPKGASVIREIDRFAKRVGEVGHGTEIAGSLRATYKGQDRVFIISDMQTVDAGTSSAIPPNVPLYGFNLGGYKHGAIPSGQGRRHEFGGLTDATFRLVPLLERGADGTWPWMA